MKRLMKLLAAGLLALGTLGACANRPEENSEGGGSPKIVVTIFPIYDWVMNILGDNPAGMDVTMLMQNGSDLHNYQPTADDIRKIADCDVFVCVGGESDKWVDDALKEAVNTDMKVIRLMDVIGSDLKVEEAVEGMEAEEEGEEEEEEYDEHVWLSLRSAMKCVTALSEAIADKDSDNKALYLRNAADYSAQLSALDQEYASMVSSAQRHLLLFGDRFPFRYLTDDYDLAYYAAFKGCSAETEASFETVLFLAGKLKEEKLPAVMIIEGSDGKIADTIIRTAEVKDCGVLTLDSMQSVTRDRVEKGAAYIDIMKQNLEILRKALN